MRDISISEIIGTNTILFLPQIRQGILYPWLNLMGFYPKKTPNIQDFSYDSGSVNGVALDSGGMSYHYLQANQDSLKVCCISQRFIPVDETSSSNLQELAQKTGLDCILQYLDYPSNPDRFSAFEYLHESILHYGGGSNWNSDPIGFHQIKTKTMLEAFGNAMFFPSENQRSS
jgi:hypothetical protein